MRAATRSVSNFILNQKGLTIGEILIALAINSIVVLAVVTLVSQTMISGKTSENRQELATDFGLLQNFFAREIPNAGGLSLPAESAFWVEDNCGARVPFADCDQSDRLTLARTDAGPVCTIKTWDSATNLVTFPSDPVDPTVCCLSSTPLLHQHIMFVNGFDFRQFWVTSSDVTACSANVVAGPMAPHDNVDNTYNWVNGLVIPVQIETFFFDPVRQLFNRFTYKTVGTSAVDGSSLVLADRMLDFQVALGYDYNPADGLLTDDGSATDEWLYNASGDVAGAGVFDPTVLPRNSLRMIGIGWVLGATGAGNVGAKEASILNGPVRSKTGWVVQSGVAKFGLRSIYVFD